MKQRLITAAVGVCIVVPIFIFSDTFAWEIFITLCSVIGTFELVRALRLMARPELSLPSLLYALIVPLFSGSNYQVIFDLKVLYLCIMLFSGIVVNRCDSPEKVCLAAAFTVYVVASFASLLLLRRMDIGAYLFMLVFVGAWMTDSFAYFVGRFCGRHKLCPKISPKKTVEGAIGGWVGCIVCFLIYGFIIETFTDKSADYLLLILTGAVIGVVSQMGDLVASALKRRVKIKDFSNLLPGHGGVLDRFDSVMSVSVFLLFFASRVALFV